MGTGTAGSHGYTDVCRVLRISIPTPLKSAFPCSLDQSRRVVTSSSPQPRRSRREDQGKELVQRQNWYITSALADATITAT